MSILGGMDYKGITGQDVFAKKSIQDDIADQEADEEKDGIDDDSPIAEPILCQFFFRFL